MSKQNSPKHDSVLEQKWSQPRVLRSELNPYSDPGLDCTGDPGKTDPSQAADCDVNNIVKTFQRTGVLPGVNAQTLYADVSDALTYHDALNVVLHAEEQFLSLDAHTRKRFSNDPAEFLEFASNPKNAHEMIKLGLASKTPISDAERIVGAITEASAASKPPLPAEPAPASGKKRSDS